MRPVNALLFLASMVAGVACSGAHDAPRDRAVSAAASPGNEASGLNVPSLLAFSVDELTLRIGPRHPLPAGFADPSLAPLVQRHERLDSTTFFQYRGLSLVASYDYDSRRVSELLLLGANESELMRRARLQLGAERYLVLPVFQESHPTQLLGLRVLAIALNQ